MRWQTVVYKNGDLRERQFFAWLPVDIYHNKDFTETRWLETVRVREKYVTSWSESWWLAQEFLEVIKPVKARALPKT